MKNKWLMFLCSSIGCIGISLTIGFVAAALAQQGAIQPVPMAPGISPIGSPTFVNVGSLGGDVLTWAAAVFTPILGTMITAGIYQLFKKLGIDMTDAMRARLNEMVVNGLNLGAQKATEAVQRSQPIDVKSQAVAHAIDYVQTHGQDTLKALGFDPHDKVTIAAIQARAESAILDPKAATAPVLNTPAKNGAGNAAQGSSS